MPNFMEFGQHFSFWDQIEKNLRTGMLLLINLMARFSII